MLPYTDKTILVPIVILLLLFACKNHNTQENNYIENDIDTIEKADYVQEITDERITREIKDKNYVIFVEPTLFYLDSLKNVSKDDDFYTTVDDATFLYDNGKRSCN